MEQDVVSALILEPQGSVTRGAACVEMTYGTQVNFGEHKIFATVRLTCDQNVPAVDAAGEAGFLKAYNLVQQGLEYLNSIVKT